MRARHLLVLGASIVALGLGTAPVTASAGSKVHFQIHVGTPYVVHHQPPVIYYPHVVHRWGHPYHHGYRRGGHGYGHHRGNRVCQIAHGPPRHYGHQDD